MAKELVIKLALRVLHRVRGRMLPEETLREHVNLGLDREDRLDGAQMRAELNFAMAQGWVDCEATAHGKLKWWITDAGEVELRR